MEREIAIEVKNLYISYRNLQKFSIKQSLLHFKKVQADVFQAVKDVSFEVEKGEILGIIGKNGSGKSTMLKALAGIFSPDTGSIDLKNHSVSLLSIGVGFEKEMSGRENIILSGMLLGFSEEFIRSKMDEIIEFAGLGKFIDMPVSFAEETKKEPTYMRMDHPLKEENNWDISNELIMPGEAFYTVPKFEVTYDHGYYGIPADADLVFDVRFLPNPYYIDELKKQTGNDKPVQDYVMGFDVSHVFLNKLTDMVQFLLPNYVQEGKNQLIIGIGCTGGKHRSVTLANKLFESLSLQNDYGIRIEHRDIGK